MVVVSIRFGVRIFHDQFIDGHHLFDYTCHIVMAFVEKDKG
jgi:hypothetical protein